MQRPTFIVTSGLIVGRKREPLGLKCKLHRGEMIRIEHRGIDSHRVLSDRGEFFGGDCRDESLGALRHVAFQCAHLLPLQRSAQGQAFAHHAAVERGFKFPVAGKKALLGSINLGKELEGIRQASALLVKKRRNLRRPHQPVACVAKGRVQFGRIDRNAVAL